MDPRIAGVLRSLSVVEGEVEPERAPSHFDLAALNRLDSSPDRVEEFTVWHSPLGWGLSGDLAPKAKEYAENLASRLKVDRVRVARTYAYSLRGVYVTGDLAGVVALRYATSHGDYSRLDSLTSELERLAESLNTMLWESLQYLNWLANYELYERPASIVRQFYSKHAKYLEIRVSPPWEKWEPWLVDIDCPSVLKGLLIGRQGRTVKALEERLKTELGGSWRIKVHGREYLDDRYYEENPNIQLPPEAMKLVSQVLPALKELKDRWGIDLNTLQRLLEQLEKPEEEGVEEGY